MDKKGYVNIDCRDIMESNPEEDLVYVSIYRKRLYKLAKNIKIYTLLTFLIFSCVELEFNNLTIMEYILSSSSLTLMMGFVLGSLLTTVVIFKLLSRK